MQFKTSLAKRKNSKIVRKAVKEYLIKDNTSRVKNLLQLLDRTKSARHQLDIIQAMRKGTKGHSGYNDISQSYFDTYKASQSLNREKCQINLKSKKFVFSKPNSMSNKKIYQKVIETRARHNRSLSMLKNQRKEISLFENTYNSSKKKFEIVAMPFKVSIKRKNKVDAFCQSTDQLENNRPSHRMAKSEYFINPNLKPTEKDKFILSSVLKQRPVFQNEKIKSESPSRPEIFIRGTSTPRGIFQTAQKAKTSNSSCRVRKTILINPAKRLAFINSIQDFSPC
ncbi:unnamed protein product [Moneuplotes crassus]|uniref:Uncharacterized protein n=1 Tax=Euplotes crassus TaxID=5936 RepID=A0AAD1UTJ2_EUPCR|nr:unnamed protein product [Moneuplotes crassus]